MTWRRQATSHCPKQWWLIYWCIYASLCLNGLSILLNRCMYVCYDVEHFFANAYVGRLNGNVHRSHWVRLYSSNLPRIDFNLLYLLGHRFVILLHLLGPQCLTRCMSGRIRWMVSIIIVWNPTMKNHINTTSLDNNRCYTFGEWKWANWLYWDAAVILNDQFSNSY